MPFSRNGTVQLWLVRTQLTDPKVLHSNHSDAGREGVQSRAETPKQKKLSGSMQQNDTKYSHCRCSVFKGVLCFKTNPVQDKGWENPCSQDHCPASWQAGGPGLVYAVQLEECFPVGNQLSQNPREEPSCLEPLSAPNSAHRTQVSHLQSSCLRLERGNNFHLQISV